MLCLLIIIMHQGSFCPNFQFSRSVVSDFLQSPWIVARQASLSHHQLPEFTETHVHWIKMMSSNHLILCCPLLLPPSIFPSIRIFSSQLFALGGQSIGVSASTWVLPMNIQDWFPLGWTGWISLLSKRLSRVFSNTTVQKHQFFSFLYSPTLISIHDYCKNIALTRWTFVGKGMSLLFNMLSRLVITRILD